MFFIISGVTKQKDVAIIVSNRYTFTHYDCGYPDGGLWFPVGAQHCDLSAQHHR